MFLRALYYIFNIMFLQISRYLLFARNYSNKDPALAESAYLAKSTILVLYNFRTCRNSIFHDEIPMGFRCANNRRIIEIAIRSRRKIGCLAWEVSKVHEYMHSSDTIVFRSLFKIKLLCSNRLYFFFFHRVGINDNNGRNSRRRYWFEYYRRFNRFHARDSSPGLFAEFSIFVGEYLVRGIYHPSIPVPYRGVFRRICDLPWYRNENSRLWLTFRDGGGSWNLSL